MPEFPLSQKGTQPLLTLAIPTHNRAERLVLLLEMLLPQLAPYAGEIQLIVSDNASTDDTPRVIATSVQSFAEAGIELEPHRNPVNLGPDGNFLGCLRAARGHFFWICGDDDLIVPGGLAQIMALLRDASGNPADLDMLHVTSYGFRTDFAAEQQQDPYGRTVHIVTDVHRFVRIVNVMFTFVSGTIIRRDRLDSVTHEDPAAFVGTSLIQLAWVLPLLLRFRRAAVLWTRPLAVRQGHANGYSLGKVFGGNLCTMLPRLLPQRPDLYCPILNVALSRWLPGTMLELRVSADPTLRLAEAGPELRKAYGGNPRFWIFTWPVTVLPLPLARIWQKAGAFYSKALYALRTPGIRNR